MMYRGLWGFPVRSNALDANPPVTNAITLFDRMLRWLRASQVLRLASELFFLQNLHHDSNA